jgi:hypothetical protein
MMNNYQFDPLEHSIGIEQAPKPTSWTWLYWMIGGLTVAAIIFGAIHTNKRNKEKEENFQK